ncbi:MAG: NAD-dependent epimerase/dehydratase family protein [Cytophagaceae bacterium]|nr:NAD-dependent epimerase/dehydratase family protein [Cytophagaceae bacterium]
MMIFITGCNGLIGSFVARKLLSQNHHVKALRRGISNLDLVKDISDKIEWVEGDITDITLLEKYMKGADIVIHSAALVSYLPSEKELMLKINTEGTANVVNAALKNNISLFVHISSIAALGRKKNKEIIDENTFWGNSNHNTNYAISKYLSEIEVWRGFEEGLRGFIVNPSVVFGPGNWESGSTRIFKYAWDENLFYSGGEMNFIDVRDVSEIICQLLKEEKAIGQRFILNAHRMPYKDLFSEIAECLGKKKPRYKAGRIISETGWRLAALKSLVTGKDPLITRETARLSGNSFQYDHSKIRNLLNYKFMDPQDTITWVCDELKRRNNV